jgi:hypothetical protein
MSLKREGNAFLKFWKTRAYEFLPKGSKVHHVSVRPKTTLERMWVSTNPNRTRWLVIEWSKDEKSHTITKVSIK